MNDIIVDTMYNSIEQSCIGQKIVTVSRIKEKEYSYKSYYRQRHLDFKDLPECYDKENIISHILVRSTQSMGRTKQ